MSVRVSKIKTWIGHHAIGLAIAACAITSVLGLVLIIAIGRLNNTPAWWLKLEAISDNDPKVIQQAEQLENAITTQLTKVRDAHDPRWAVAIQPEQANDWFEARLIDTVTTHLGDDAWPSEIESVRISVEDDQLIIGARVVHSSGAFVVWANVGIELDAQGDLWAAISSAHIGGTPVPISVLALTGNSAFTHSRIHIGYGKIDLGDGRAGQLIAVRINNGRLELVMETKVAD